MDSADYRYSADGNDTVVKSHDKRKVSVKVLWRRSRRVRSHDRKAQLAFSQMRMRRSLDELLALCAAAGTSLDSIDGPPGVPPSLVAAVRPPRRGGEPVLMQSPDGRQMIAVVDGRGEPAAWWAEIRDLAGS
jgi:hypothetical protein